MEKKYLQEEFNDVEAIIKLSATRKENNDLSLISKITYIKGGEEVKFNELTYPEYKWLAHLSNVAFTNFTIMACRMDIEKGVVSKAEGEKMLEHLQLNLKMAEYLIKHPVKKE